LQVLSTTRRASRREMRFAVEVVVIAVWEWDREVVVWGWG
jgi:hypothetical protein